MPYDGNGNYIRTHNWVADAANAIDISAPEMDQEDNGFAAALSNAVTRDGQGKMTVDFLPNANNVLNLGSGALQWASLNGTPISQIIPTQQGIGGLLNPRTAAEVTASVTPINFAYPQGDIRRYGAVGNNSTDCTTAIRNAIKVAQAAQGGGGSGVVYIPPGRFVVSGTLSVTLGFVTIYGEDQGVSVIQCNTSGIGDVLLINNPGNEIFGVNIRRVFVACQAGLASPPNGIHLKDASECIVEDCAAANCNDGVRLNGSNLNFVWSFASAGCVNGVRLTVQGTSKLFNNTINWMQYLDLFNSSNAGILYGGTTANLSVRDSYIEETPHSTLIQPDSGVTQLAIDGIHYDNVTSWNAAGDSFTGTDYLAILPPSGSGSYVHVTNFTIANAVSNQSNSSTFHINLLQNGNTNLTTQYLQIAIIGGEFYGASTAVVHSDATTCTGDIRGNVLALTGYQTGAAIPLRNGAGTVGWGTEESGSFTPTDTSGASLTYTNVLGTYVRKGTVVTATLRVTFPTTANGSAVSIGGLPFAAISTASSVFGGSINFQSASLNMMPLVGANASNVQLFTTAGAGVTNSQMSTFDLRMTVTYQSQ